MFSDGTKNHEFKFISFTSLHINVQIRVSADYSIDVGQISGTSKKNRPWLTSLLFFFFLFLLYIYISKTDEIEPKLALSVY